MYDILFFLVGASPLLLFFLAIGINAAFPNTLKAIDKKLSELIGGAGQAKS